MTSPETNPAGESEARQADPVARPTLLGKVRGAFNSWLGADTEALEGKSSNELAEIRTDLAVTRTLMAADRTLMAWIRTALSMYSFGFTIYKLLEAYEEAGTHLMRGQTPREIGLFLTGMGTFAMVMGVFEYWQTFKELRLMKELQATRPTFIMGILMGVMGIVLFFAIITKLF